MRVTYDPLHPRGGRLYIIISHKGSQNAFAHIFWSKRTREIEPKLFECWAAGGPAFKQLRVNVCCLPGTWRGRGGWDSISITSNWGLVKTSLICPIDSVTPPTIAIFFRYRIFVDISALFCLWYSSLDTACIVRNVTLYFSYIQQHNRLRITTITYFCVWKRWIPANTHCITFVQCWINVVQII